MINSRTQYFDLPLPHANNTLAEDVARLIQALQGIDSAAKGFKDKTDSDDAQLGSIQALVTAAKNAASSLSSLSSLLSSHTHTGGNGGQVPYSSLSGAPTLGTSATKDVGTGAGTVCAGNDSRLSNARTPTAHKANHASGGSDALTAADIGAQPTITGAATSVTTSNLSASMALVSDASGKIGASSRISGADLTAMREAIIAGPGWFPGWSIELQNSDGSTPPTDPTQPAQILYAKGSERIKAVLTWTNGRVTRIVCWYSANGGTNYDVIKGGATNGYCNLTYDANGYFLSASWS